MCRGVRIRDGRCELRVVRETGKARRWGGGEGDARGNSPVAAELTSLADAPAKNGIQ